MADLKKFSELLPTAARNGDAIPTLATRIPAPPGYQNRDDYLIGLRELYDSGAQVTNVKAYNASGSSAATALASAAAASAATVNLVDAGTFEVGHGLFIPGAGAGGGKYIGAITSKNGNAVGVSPPIATSVSSTTEVKHDDTVAIQAAINAGSAADTFDEVTTGSAAIASNIIFLPRGHYRCTSGLTLGKSTSLVGCGTSLYWNDVGILVLGSPSVTCLDFSDMTAGAGITLSINGSFNRIHSLELLGPTGFEETSTTGIAGTGAIDFRVEDVLIRNWNIGCNYSKVAGRHVGVHIYNCYGDCLLLRECAFWTSLDSTNSNSATGNSIHLSAQGAGCHDIHFHDLQVDEGGGPATIQIDEGQDISINNTVVFTAAGGYGIRLGDGTSSPTGVSLNNVRIKQKQDYTPSRVIKNLVLRGGGHKLLNVVTEKGTHTPPANDIQNDTTDSVIINLNGTSNLPLADVQIFTTDGIWKKPANGKWTEVFLIGAGGGGGSGRKGAAGSSRSGGSGGSGGAILRWRTPTSVLADTENILVPSGGVGGAAVATDSTAGNAGVSPSFPTQFGDIWVRAGAGVGGAGGTASNTAAAAGAVGEISGGPGGLSNIASTATTPAVITGYGASGGGGGGGISSANAALDGGGGGSRGSAIYLSNFNGGGGAAGGVNHGQDGISVSATQPGGGTGGGGGKYQTGSGGHGGNGGLYGAGGGGGSAGLDGVAASGAGGNGGGGLCIVITYL